MAPLMGWNTIDVELTAWERRITLLTPADPSKCTKSPVPRLKRTDATIASEPLVHRPRDFIVCADLVLVRL